MRITQNFYYKILPHIYIDIYKKRKFLATKHDKYFSRIAQKQETLDQKLYICQNLLYVPSKI